MVNGLPMTVHRFVRNHFDSMSSVDVLLLHWQRPRRWSSLAVARELRLNEEQTAGLLAQITERGLVRRQSIEFCYAPRTDEVAGVVTQLAENYARYRWRFTPSCSQGNSTRNRSGWSGPHIPGRVVTT